LYFTLIERTSATYLSMASYVTPLSGILLGASVLNEPVSGNENKKGYTTMSKQSKTKRDMKKKRRARMAASSAHQRRLVEAEQDSTMWWWAGGIGVALLALAIILWFTIGPGKSPAPTPTPLPPPTALPTSVPTSTPVADAEPSGEKSSTMPENPADRANMYSNPPEMQIDPTKVYLATIETNKGVIELELYPEHAPKTVNNFVFLAREGFYDGVKFHRVISDFMIQGGDPTGTGSSGPGYQFEDEVTDNPLTHETGVISMANAGPNTNGSQFFITHSPQPHLNGRHTVFGKVINGQEVVNAIEQGDVMERIEIAERGD
jgi:peptidyl-prolyl cis-trans isomerase B (cyclophilin B)